MPDIRWVLLALLVLVLAVIGWLSYLLATWDQIHLDQDED